MSTLSARFLVAASVALCGAFTSSSHAVVVDFEDFDLGGAEFLDVSSPLLVPNVAGSGVSLGIHQGFDNRIYDLVEFSGSYLAPGPQALIDMNWINASNPIGTDIVFSESVAAFSLIAGDFGSDDDSPLRIEAFDVNDISLGVATASWPESATAPFATLSLNVTGIRRVHYSSGGQFTNSTFIDNLSFIPQVPEPTTSTLMLFAVIVLCRPKVRRGTS